jgi:hypothetical protein
LFSSARAEHGEPDGKGSRRQLAFFNAYCGCDKVYLEPYRDGLMIPRSTFHAHPGVRENNVEVSGA